MCSYKAANQCDVISIIISLCLTLKYINTGTYLNTFPPMCCHPHITGYNKDGTSASCVQSKISLSIYCSSVCHSRSGLCNTGEPDKLLKCFCSLEPFVHQVTKTTHWFPLKSWHKRRIIFPWKRHKFINVRVQLFELPKCKRFRGISHSKISSGRW